MKFINLKINKLKISLFIFVLIITLIWTFPAKYLFSFLLSSNNFLFSKIDGNILSLNVKNLENRYLFVDNLLINNRFVYLSLEFNNKLKIIYIPFKGIHITSKNFNLSEILKDKKFILAKISGDLEVYKNNNLKLLKGEGDIIVKRLKFFNVGRLKINYELKDLKEYSKLTVDLNGNSINGKFNGKVIWKDKFILEGNFSGKFFNQSINRNIHKEFNVKYFKFIDRLP